MSESYRNEDVEAAAIKATLLEMARPDLYRHNEFRVLSLPTRVTDRDIQKYLRRMQLEQKFGGGQKSDAQRNAIAPLPLVPLPGMGEITEAQSHLADAGRRLISEFFWFWSEVKAASVDAAHSSATGVHDVDEALLALSQSDIETAHGLWSKQAASGDHQGIATHNMAVMFHAAALDIELAADGQPPDDELKQRRDYYWSKALEMWKSLVSCEKPWNYLMARVDELNDPRVKRATVEQLRTTLPVLLLTINARLAVRASQDGASADAKRQVRLMREFAFTPDIETQARQCALEPLRHHLYDLCRLTEREANKAPEHGAQVAARLLERARPLLIAVDDLLPPRDLLRADMLDAVAHTVHEAALKKAQLLNHYSTREWESIQQLFERTSRYAATPVMRERINKTLSLVQNDVQYSISKSCWFCSEQEGTAEHMLLETMYHWVGYKKYEYYDVPVPRCARCSAAHARVDKIAVWFGLIGAIIGIVIAIGEFYFLIEILGGWTFVAAIITVIALALLGGSAGNKLGCRTLPHETKPATHKMNFPVIKELFSKGWTNNKPS